MSDDRERDGGELKYSVGITEGPRGSHTCLEGGNVTASAVIGDWIGHGEDKKL